MTEWDEAYRFGYQPEELKRLGDQHRVWAEDNARFLVRAGFKPGDTVVDLGCGPGFTTLDLARIVGTTGRVIAVDRDGERSLPLLRERAETAGLSNVETQAVELDAFDLPAGSVDGVYGRWVLMYLNEADSLALARRAVAWLKPGGVLALAEFCNYRHIHVHPPCAHLPAVGEALHGAVAKVRGANPEIGNVLPGELADAGLDIDLHVVTKAIRATTPDWSWPDTLFRDHLPALVDDGHLSQGDLDAFFLEWESRSRDPGAVFFASPMLEIVGRR